MRERINKVRNVMIKISQKNCLKYLHRDSLSKCYYNLLLTGRMNCSLRFVFFDHCSFDVIVLLTSLAIGDTEGKTDNYYLTHLILMFYFNTPWKPQKTTKFAL